MSANPLTSNSARRLLSVAVVAALTLPAAAAGARPAKNRIAAVDAGEIDGATAIAIRGSRTPTFTVYKLKRPSRVVIDIANAELSRSLRGSDGTATFDVNSWGVSQVSAHALDGSTSTVRVVVRMARPGSYKVKADGDDVVIRVMPRDAPPKAVADANAKAEAKRAKAEVERAQAEARKAKAEAKRAVAKAEKMAKRARAAERTAKDEAHAARLEASQARAAARRARDEADQARREAQRAKQRAEQSEATASRRVDEAKSMLAEADRKLRAARETKAKAERAAKIAEQRSAEAKAEATRTAKASAEAREEARRLYAAAKEAEKKGRRDAKQLEREAEKAAEAAERQRRIAAKAKSEADERRAEAEAAAEQAKQRRKTAVLVAHQANEQRKLAEARREKAEADLAEARRELASAVKRRGDAEKQAAAARDKAERVGKSEQRAIAAARRARAAADELRAELTAAKARVDALRTEKVQTEARLARLRKQNTRNKAELARVRAERDRTNEQMAALLAEREKLEAARKLAEKRAEQAAAETRAAKHARRAAEQQVADAAAKARAAKDARRAAEKKAADAIAETRAARNARRAAEQQVADAAAEARTAKDARRAAEKKVADAAAEARAARDARRAAEKKAADAAAETRAARDARRAAEKKAADAAAAMRAARKARRIAEEKAAAAERLASEARDSARAETNRVEAGTKRARAESKQAQAESKRAQAESKRAQAESKRAQAEAAKAKAEAKRVRAEAQKARADAAKAKAEAQTARVEAARAKAEADRAREQAREARADAKRAARTTAAPPEPTPTPKPTPAAVREVDYVDRGSVARVVINLEGKATPKVLSAKGRKAILEIPDAHIADELERTLDTSRYGGPIAAVSSYRDPRDAGKVRVVVDLDKPTESVLKRKGTVYYWDFDKPKAAARTKRPAPARTPPKPRPSVGTSTPITSKTVAQSRRRRKVYRGRKIDLDFKDADIHNLLRLLADVGGVNIVIPDEIRASVTVRLRNVPWDQAMEVILQSKGLWYRREGSLIRIASRKVLDAEDKAEAERIASLARTEAPEPEVYTLNYAVANQMRPRLTPLLSPKGRIEVDRRTNSLIVNDIAAHRRRIIELVDRLDTQTPQIQIEARIVEARTSFRREFGIQWGGRASATQAGGNATGLIFPSDVVVAGAADDGQTNGTGVAAVPTDFAVNLPAAIGSGAGGGLGFSFGSVGGNFGINLRLSAAEDQGSIRIVSAPKITTLNNIQASISQGVSIPISVISANGVQTQFVPADLSLKVTPHVSQKDCTIAMDLRVTKNEADFANTGARGDPSLLRKEARTSILVADGETSVIGGVYTRSTGWSKAKVPFFADLPFIGWLFRNKSESDERTEVLVFITPKITNRAFLRCE